MNTGISAINDEVQRASAFMRPLFTEIGKVIVGQNYLVERLLIGLAGQRPRPAGRRARPGQDPGGQDAGRRASNVNFPRSSSRRTCCPRT